MTAAYALRKMVEAEQVEFAALLGEITPEQWAVASLCQGWSIQDVVIHIALHTHSTARQRTVQLARLGFSVARQLDLDRPRTTVDLVEWLASPPTLGGPTNILTQLSELVIHQQDVRRPLGIHRTIPAERLSVVLDFGLTRVGSASVALARRRAKGLRLVAPDIGWSAGTGSELCGPGEAVFMALNGRASALEDLSGDGLQVLVDRISA